MKARRGAFPVALVLLATALALAGPRASAATHRPYDAPSAQGSRSVVPPLPTGYLEHQEAGVTFAYHPSAHERVRASIATVMRTRAAMTEELGREVLPKLEIRVAFRTELTAPSDRTGHRGDFAFVAKWLHKLCVLESDGRCAHFPFHMNTEIYSDLVR